MAQESFAQGGAFITLQIQLKKKEMEDFQLEVSELEEKKQRQAEVNKQLKAEQMKQVKRLLREVKEQERNLEQEELLHKERQEQAFGDNLRLASDQERKLTDLRNELADLQEQLLTLQAEKQLWYDYKTEGSREHRQQIQRLEAELVIMQEGFQQMSDSIRRLQDDTFREIDQKTVKVMNEKRSQAAERAIKQLDNISQWEIEDNEWLKKEHAVYQEEVSLLDQAVQKLEMENLELVSELLQSRLSNLHAARRNAFTSLDAALEASDLGPGIQEEEMLRPTQESETSGRPKTPPREAVPSWTTDSEGCDAGGGRIPTSRRPTGPTPWEPSVPMCNDQGTAQQDVPHLGRVEEELTIVGHPAPLHPQLTHAAASATGARREWPLTPSIIHGRFK